MSVSNIIVTDIGYKTKDWPPEILELLPKNYRPERMEFEIEGVNNAIANGLRRTILSELPVKTMRFDFDDLKTNVKFMLNDMLLSRIRLIPLDQTVPKDMILSLNITNNLDSYMKVKSSDIEVEGGSKKFKDKLPFNETHTIYELGPKEFIQIPRIYIDIGYDYMQDAGCYSVAHNLTCIPLDSRPVDKYVDNTSTVSSSMSNPHHYKLSFKTNGTMRPELIVYTACEEIQQRLRTVIDLVHTIYVENNIQYLIINGESSTIGNILMKTISEMIPDIKLVTYSVNSNKRQMTLKIYSNDEAANIIIAASKNAIAQYEQIKKMFK